MLLQKNPLTMSGLLKQCWLFTYQTPAEAVGHLLPPQLEPVTYRGYAFWNIVVCEIEGLRPKLLPGFWGIRYWHVAYRLYVCFRPASGESIEGLYFVRSDCDNTLVAAAGNLLTNFNFHLAAIEIRHGISTMTIEIDSADAPAHICLRTDVPSELPVHSAFESLEEAAAFLKYEPAGISTSPDGKTNVVRIARVERNWRSKLVQVQTAHWTFLDGQPVLPEICYQIAPIAYQWNRGRVYT